jgi:FkbM family methyltransferase
VTVKSRKAVFAGPARNCAQYLPGVLRNLELLAREFGETFTIIVENDSTDSTKSILKSWTEGRRARLIEMDGLAERVPNITERLAVARNRYLQEIRESSLKDFDYLVMLDMDYPNSQMISMQGFSKAIGMLENDEGIAGVFANQVPLYYDVWALRHETLSPDDCWTRVESDKALLGHDEAVRKHVYARQIFIHPEGDPIEVDSAFGGLAIYRMSDALNGTYAGLSQDGVEICEHVDFNLGIRRTGKRLYILSAMLNLTCFEHVDSKNRYRVMPIHANGNACSLLAVADHQLDTYRNKYPLYDERYPILGAIYSTYRNGSVIDVGANIGDGLALCRMHGCRSRYIAVEGCKDFFSLLYANVFINSGNFGDVRLVDKYINIGSDHVCVSVVSGTASLIPADKASSSMGAGDFVSLEAVDDGAAGLIKIDTDGNDAKILLNNMAYLKGRRPVIWAEAEVFTEELLVEWSLALDQMSQIYEHVLAFDNFGFLIVAGKISEVMATVKILLRYICSQRTCDQTLLGQPIIYYLDLAFFSADDADLYECFVARLKEHRQPES